MHPLNRWALAATGLGLVAAVVFGVEQAGRGFPDGHLTELDRWLVGPEAAVVGAVWGVTVVAWKRRRWAQVCFWSAAAVWGVAQVLLPWIGRGIGLDAGGGG